MKAWCAARNNYSSLEQLREWCFRVTWARSEDECYDIDRYVCKNSEATFHKYRTEGSYAVGMERRRSGVGYSGGYSPQQFELERVS